LTDPDTILTQEITRLPPLFPISLEEIAMRILNQSLPRGCPCLGSFFSESTTALKIVRKHSVNPVFEY